MSTLAWADAVTGLVRIACWMMSPSLSAVSVWISNVSDAARIVSMYAELGGGGIVSRPWADSDWDASAVTRAVTRAVTKAVMRALKNPTPLSRADGCRKVDAFTCLRTRY